MTFKNTSNKKRTVKKIKYILIELFWLFLKFALCKKEKEKDNVSKQYNKTLR